MTKKKLTYHSATSELENILSDLNEGNIVIDEMTQMVNRAKELIEYCRNSLRDIESTIGESQTSK